MILAAQDIHKLKESGIIYPFHERSVAYGYTFGLSCCGYDVRIAEDYIMWPHRFVLASTVEKFNMPTNVAAVVHDKSSMARVGIAVQNTFIEPGWRGYLTLEISNHSWKFIRLRAGQPIAQIVFHQLTASTVQAYDGKYQDQKRGPQPSIKD